MYSNDFPHDAAFVLFFGGSFDPVHLGHIEMLRAVQKQKPFDRVYWLPAGLAPHKPGRRTASADHRLAMLQCASEDEPNWQVDDRELLRPGQSFTADTMDEVHREHPAWHLHFLIGADMVAILPKWRNIHHLARIVHFLAVGRTGTQLESAAAAARREIPGLRLDLIGAPLLDLSSTEIRNRAARSESLEGLVPPRVAAYIRQHHLYHDTPRDGR